MGLRFAGDTYQLSAVVYHVKGQHETAGQFYTKAMDSLSDRPAEGFEKIRLVQEFAGFLRDTGRAQQAEALLDAK